MSFSVELWNGYETVFNNFSLHRRGLRDYLQMLIEIHDAGVEYANTFKKILDCNYAVSTHSTLSQGIMAFRNDLQNQFNYNVDFTKSIKDELIDPLKEFYNIQTDTGRNYNIKFRSADKKYKESIEKMYMLRSKFHSTAKSAEKFKLELETCKFNKRLKSVELQKLEMKTQSMLKEAKDYERLYIQTVNAANSEREMYVEIMKKTLSDFQTLEEEYIDFTKDLLRKFVIYQVALNRNMQYDIERKSNIMEGININADIQTFCNKYNTNSLPPYKFEFIPYSSDMDKTNTTSDTEKTIRQNVKNFINNVFFEEVPQFDVDNQDNKYFNEIQTLVDYSWEGKKLQNDEKALFNNYMKEKKYRRHFIKCLNKIRSEGIFNLDSTSYKSISELLWLSIGHINKETDYESAKGIMLISQTFYKTATELNKPRIFIQAAIDKHSLWSYTSFWEGLIKYSVNEELHTQKNYNIYTFESNTEKLRKNKQTAFNQLNTYVYNMLNFEILKTTIKNIIYSFGRYYEFEEKQIEEFINIIKSFEYRNKDDAEHSNNNSDSSNSSNSKQVPQSQVPSKQSIPEEMEEVIIVKEKDNAKVEVVKVEKESNNEDKDRNMDNDIKDDDNNKSKSKNSNDEKKDIINFNSTNNSDSSA